MTPTPKLQASEDSWDQWGVYVLKKLERLDEHYEALREEVGKIHTEIATLKVKAGAWGAIGAAIPVLALLLIQLIR
jgi:hypothetical protein